MRVVFNQQITIGSGATTEQSTDVNTTIVVGDRGVYVKRKGGGKAVVVPWTCIKFVEPWDDGHHDEVPRWLNFEKPAPAQATTPQSQQGVSNHKR